MKRAEVERMARKQGKCPYDLMVEMLAKRPSTVPDLRKLNAKLGMVLLKVKGGYERQDARDGRTLDEKPVSVVELIEDADQLSSDWDSTNFGVED